jgi:hypothetical protein
VPQHLILRLALLTIAAMVSLLGCGRSSPNSSDRPGGPATHSARTDGTPPERRPVSSWPSYPDEQDAVAALTWLTDAREDPHPGLRLAALESWARNPGDTFDPATYALVDPDESVRERAQELLEQALAHR